MRLSVARLVTLSVLVATLGAPAVLSAQSRAQSRAESRAGECPTEWREPVVCTVDLSVAAEGERRATAVEGSSLELPTRTRIDLYADPTDQWGHRFPLQRFELRIEPGRNCDELLEIQRREEEGEFLLETGGRTGTCDLLLWVPGNMNLDRELRVEVSRERAGGYERTESELLARWLFEAILGREPDTSGLRTAAMSVQSGELRSRVEALVGSSEYRQRRAGLSAEERLDDLYQGLLGRSPGTSGVRAYLDSIRRGNVVDVVMQILDSDELERRLDEAMHTSER